MESWPCRGLLGDLDDGVSRSRLTHRTRRPVARRGGAVPLGKAFVGADLRYVIVPDSDNGQGDSLAAFSAFVTGGLNF